MIQKIRFWLWEAPTWIPEPLIKWLLYFLCKATNHEVVSDVCKMPKHDFCVNCNRAYPYKAKR